MASKPNTNVVAGQPARLTLPEGTDLLPMDQPHHVCCSGSGPSKFHLIDLWGYSHIMETTVTKL